MLIRPGFSPLLLVLGALSLTACPAKKSEQGDGEGKAEAKQDASAETDAAAGTEGSDPEAANAAKDAKGETDARVDCPEALKGKDAADRVITKACGEVVVEGDYSMEGGTLTLEAGAHLVVEEGAKITVGYYEPSKLIVKGTAEEPVVIESKGDAVAGVWKGVRLYQKANRSELTHLTLRHAGNDDDGALRVDAEDVKITGLTVESAKQLGLRIETESGFALAASKIDVSEGPAIRTSALSADGIASDNTFGADDTVEIFKGKIESDVTLHAIPAPWVLARQVQVNGQSGGMATLTIEGGNEIRMAPVSTLDIGYYQPARLVAKGTEDAPITFKPLTGEGPGSWKYVAIYGKGEGQFDHVIFQNGGADDDKGMLFANSKAKLAVDHGTFEGAEVAVKIDGNDVELSGLANTTFKGSETPIACTPLVFGGVKGGNVYEDGEGSKIHLSSGKVEDDTTWTAQSVLVELDGDVNVDKEARLTVEAGSKFAVEDGVKISVGYYERAALELAGTAEAPIVLAGLRDETGTWGPITFYKKSRGSRISHVELANVAGDAAVTVQDEADLKVEKLSCTNCEGKTLAWTCKAKVEATEVANSQAPTGCK